MASTVLTAAASVVTDHYVEHKSTIPANAGEIVKLFVRERNGSNGGPRKPVLMLHGEASRPSPASTWTTRSTAGPRNWPRRATTSS